MVKDHSDSEKGNPLPPHGLLFPISSKGSFICTIPDRIAHTTAFVTPVVEHWMERDIAQWVHSMKDRSDDPSHHERTLLPRSYLALLYMYIFLLRRCIKSILPLTPSPFFSCSLYPPVPTRLLPPPFSSCPLQRNQRRPVRVPVIGVCYNNLL